MLRKMWQSLTGKQDAKDVVQSMVGKQDRSGETDAERQSRQDDENSTTAATSPGAF